MGLLDRVVGGRLVPPPELEPPEAAELRLVAVLRGLLVAAVRAAGAGLEDTVLAVTVTGALSVAGLAAGVAAGAAAGAGIAVTGVAAAGVEAAEVPTTGLVELVLAAVALAFARDLGVAMERKGRSPVVGALKRGGLRIART